VFTQINPDLSMILQLKNGDQKAMAQVLDKYGNALYGAIYQIVRSEDIAKDLMQDASIKIWKNIKSYDEKKGRLFTWLLRVCRNTAIDKVRTGKFKSIAQSKTIEETVYNTVAHSEEMNIPDSGLQQVISRLDEKYQQVINLIYLQGNLLGENPLLILVIISLLIVLIK